MLHRTFPASFVREFAESLEANNIDDLWIIEDCFFTAGISQAATALARTERLNVGLGILPAVARMDIGAIAALTASFRSLTLKDANGFRAMTTVE